MRTVVLFMALGMPIGCASTVDHRGEIPGSPTTERTKPCDDSEEAALKRRWRIVGSGQRTTSIELRARGDGTVHHAVLTSSSGVGVNDAYALCLAMRTSLPPSPDGQPTMKVVPFALKLDEGA